MKIISLALVLAAPMAMVACGTPQSEFGVYRQSDGTVGVHAPKSAKETEAQAAAAEECAARVLRGLHASRAGGAAERTAGNGQKLGAAWFAEVERVLGQ